MRSPSPAAAVYRSIEAIPAADWDRCFPGDPEGWDFYRAVEDAGPPGFEWRYIALLEDGQPVAVAPVFLTRYRLDTTVQGPLRRITEALARALPRLMTLNLAALGSPVAEQCHLGFAPEVADERKPAMLDHLLDAFEDLATAENCGLTAIKDAGEADMPSWRSFAARRGYQAMPGLPTGVLKVPPGGLDAYLATLSRATRKDLRRKLRARESLRVERRHAIDDIVAEVGALYEETVAHSAMQFEHLPSDYFAAVLRRLAPAASMVLYWANERLVAFNLMIETPTRLVDKYIGMHYPAVRRYNLYYLSWLENVAYCAERGIGTYQSGQAFYGPKLRLGCRLSPNWLMFRHRRPALNAIFRLVAKLVRLDRFDPAIARLMEEHA
jgi:hypothetical protein